MNGRILVISAILAIAGTVRADDLPFSYDSYAAALEESVDDGGMVNYKNLKANRKSLDTFVGTIGKLDRKTYEKWTEAEKIAFWVNAYNALTLRAIIDHYPIKSSWTKSLVYPKNSIRQIYGVWDKLQFVIMGKKMTLNSIEHDVVRKKFQEPRIHMALVCAAMGCPQLRREPYTGAELDEQLDEQARKFLGDRTKFRIDRDGGRIQLSSIFEWFADDFVKGYGTDSRFEGRSKSERAVLNFISGYLDHEEANYLAGERSRILYIKYDWSLNEQRK